MLHQHHPWTSPWELKRDLHCKLLLFDVAQSLPGKGVSQENLQNSWNQTGHLTLERATCASSGSSNPTMLPANGNFLFRNLHGQQKLVGVLISVGIFFFFWAAFSLSGLNRRIQIKLVGSWCQDSNHRQLCLVNFCCGCSSNKHEAIAAQICFCGTLGRTIGGLNRTWALGILAIWEKNTSNTARHLHNELNLTHLSLGLQSKTCLTENTKDIAFGARTHDIEVAHSAPHACSATWYPSVIREGGSAKHVKWRNSMGLTWFTSNPKNLLKQASPIFTTWWFQPIWKLCSSNGIIWPRGKNKKCFKPPSV